MTLRLPEQLAMHLRSWAKDEGRSLNAEIVWLLGEAVLPKELDSPVVYEKSAVEALERATPMGKSDLEALVSGISQKYEAPSKPCPGCGDPLVQDLKIKKRYCRDESCGYQEQIR